MIAVGVREKAIIAVSVVMRLKYNQLVDIKSRAKSEVFGRAILYEILWSRGASYAQIGRWCKRDHSTVIHAIRKLRHGMLTDEELRAQFEEVERTVEQHTKDDLVQRQREARQLELDTLSVAQRARIAAMRKKDLDNSAMEPFVSKRWYEIQNQKFVDHMRSVHPEREVW